MLIKEINDKADKEYMNHLKQEALERGDCIESEISKDFVIVDDDLPF